MKLSIIVPIYKTEPYLRRCIDSILAQTFTDFELILVDDGSPDNCPAICDEYAKNDPRIVVIHKENGGISDARNAGLDIAQGEFIGFVDSDDFIHRQTYEIALKIALEQKADVVQWSYEQFHNIHELNSDYFIQMAGINCNIVDSQYIVENYYHEKRFLIHHVLWTKIYKSNIFDSIRFPKGVINEDSYVLLQTLDASRKYVIIEEKFYYYYQRLDSIMHVEYSPKRFSACLIYSNNIDFFIAKKNTNQRHYAAHDYLDNYTHHMLRVHFEYKQYKKDFAPFRLQYLKKLRYIIFNPTVCRMKKLMAMMLVISPKLAYRICRKYFPECLFKSMR